jgi:hypothetical protein
MVAVSIAIGLCAYGFIRALKAAGAPGCGHHEFGHMVVCLGAVFGAMFIVAHIFAY